MGIGLVLASQWRDMPDALRETAVIDARSRHDYERGHIPGALWLGWEEWCSPAPLVAGPTLAQPGYWGLLADAAICAERLTQQGISDDAPVLVYADGPGAKGREGRIAWMLLYLGVQRVSLLQGGWHGWLACGGAVEQRVPTQAPGHFTPRLQPPRRITLPELKDAYRAGTPPIFVDTRSQAEFDGACHPYLPRMGRLPSAVLMPFTNLFDAKGQYVERDTYARLLPPALRQAGAMVSYCEVGVRASLFALIHELHTGKVVRVYDGSLMEWSLDATLPVQNGTTRYSGQ